MLRDPCSGGRVDPDSDRGKEEARRNHLETKILDPVAQGGEMKYALLSQSYDPTSSTQPNLFVERHIRK